MGSHRPCPGGIKPDPWLLDEFFARLDFALWMRTIGFLRRLLDERVRTAGYVIHDVREALMPSHRLVLLSAHRPKSGISLTWGGNPEATGGCGKEVRQIEAEVMAAL